MLADLRAAHAELAAFGSSGPHMPHKDPTCLVGDFCDGTTHNTHFVYRLWIPMELYCVVLNIFEFKCIWLFKFLKVDSIFISRRLLSVMIYLRVVGAQNHKTIISYRTFSSKELYLLFATKHSVVKNPICPLLPNIW